MGGRVTLVANPSPAVAHGVGRVQQRRKHRRSHEAAGDESGPHCPRTHIRHALVGGACGGRVYWWWGRGARHKARAVGAVSPRHGTSSLPRAGCIPVLCRHVDCRTDCRCVCLDTSSACPIAVPLAIVIVVVVVRFPAVDGGGAAARLCCCLQGLTSGIVHGSSLDCSDFRGVVALCRDLLTWAQRLVALASARPSCPPLATDATGDESLPAPEPCSHSVGDCDAAVITVSGDLVHWPASATGDVRVRPSRALLCGDVFVSAAVLP